MCIYNNNGGNDDAHALERACIAKLSSGASVIEKQKINETPVALPWVLLHPLQS
jgi:hypothetical protein